MKKTQRDQRGLFEITRQTIPRFRRFVNSKLTSCLFYSGLRHIPQVVRLGRGLLGAAPRFGSGRKSKECRLADTLRDFFRELLPDRILPSNCKFDWLSPS